MCANVVDPVVSTAAVLGTAGVFIVVPFLLVLAGCLVVAGVLDPSRRLYPIQRVLAAGMGSALAILTLKTAVDILRYLGVV